MMGRSEKKRIQKTKEIPRIERGTKKGVENESGSGLSDGRCTL